MQLEFKITGLKPRNRRRRDAAPQQQPVAPVVRTIVLAYQIEQAVQEGRARDYAEVARQIGMTRARVSQIMGLLRLPPALLETLLLADPGRLPRLTERQLRPVVAASGPLTQLEMFRRLLPPIEPQ
ncbi:MAG: hypothetical protein JSU86_07205 [Phycisphaerales bacterium]|nr:MAG: hypothetical protein JSU86_07205 [Phycisphaerales bacterium]